MRICHIRFSVYVRILLLICLHVYSIKYLSVGFDFELSLLVILRSPPYVVSTWILDGSSPSRHKASSQTIEARETILARLCYTDAGL